jgi:hypothetical protein
MAACKRRGSIVPAVSVINKGELHIEAGTFDGMVNISQSGGKGYITGGAFLASENGGTESFSLAGSKKSSVPQPPTLMKFDGIDYWIVGDSMMPEEAVVAKIGTDKYAALQDAIDVAVQDSAKTTTVEVVKDITLAEPLSIIAASYDKKKTIVLENATNTVTFAGSETSAGVTVASEVVEFRGNGTWWRESGTAALIDVGPAMATTAADAGLVCIYDGNFANTSTGHVVNVALGTLSVQGGTFEVAGTNAMCVYSKFIGTTMVMGSCCVYIDNGTFKGPTDGKAPLVGVNGSNVQTYIDVDGALTFTGSKTSVEQMSAYLAVKGMDGNYTTTIGYAFKLKSGSTDTYVIAKMAAENDSVEAGGSAVYADTDTAKKAAEAINKDKANLITIPNANTLNLTDDQKTAYGNLFIATANGTMVTVDFTDAASNTLTTAATAAVKNLDLQTFAKATDDSEQTLAISDATPGLFYTLLMGTDTPTDLSAANSVQATSTGKVTFSLKKPGAKAFFRIAISAQAIKIKTE